MAMIGHTARLAIISLERYPRIILVRDKTNITFPQGFWELPGGKMQFGKDSTLNAAAAREALEEISGLDDVLSRVQIQHTISNQRELLSTRKDITRRYLTIFPLVLYETPDIIANPSDPEIRGAKWFRLSRLPTIDKPIDGAPLEIGCWTDLHCIFNDVNFRKYFADCGFNQKRIDGLLKRWDSYSDFPSITA
jgi:8-oxo-dGTP pyrophosphatase MutT (NUDIX family)